jgi:hypothetical protein
MQFFHFVDRNYWMLHNKGPWLLATHNIVHTKSRRLS